MNYQGLSFSPTCLSSRNNEVLHSVLRQSIAMTGYFTFEKLWFTPNTPTPTPYQQYTTSTRNLPSSLKGSTRVSSLIFLMTITLAGGLFQVSLWLAGSWMCLRQTHTRHKHCYGNTRIATATHLPQRQKRLTLRYYPVTFENHTGFLSILTFLRTFFTMATAMPNDCTGKKSSYQ